MLRFVVLAASLAALTPAMAAEVWSSREGGCFDWHGRWNVQQQNDGVWIGRQGQLHAGGQCSPPSGQRNEADIRAVLVGDYFFATRFASADGNDCNYAGRIRDDRAEGFYTCSKTPGRYRFVMRFPPQTDRANPRDMADDEIEDLDEPARREPRGGGPRSDDFFRRR